MATFTLTIPDAVIPRIRKAFGGIDFVTNEPRLATLAEIQAVLLGVLKQKVIEMEAGEQSRLTAETVSKETW